MKYTNNIVLLLLVLFAFLSGLYIYSVQKLDSHLISLPPVLQTPVSLNTTINENLQNADERSAKCPNVLVKSGEVLLLYNNTDTHYEMPVIFNSLDEYANYIQIQRKKGIRCPILFLDKETSIQGEEVFRIKSTPFNDYYETFSNMQGLTIPSTKTIKPFTTFTEQEPFTSPSPSPARSPAPVRSPAQVRAPAPSPSPVRAPAPATKTTYNDFKQSDRDKNTYSQPTSGRLTEDNRTQTQSTLPKNLKPVSPRSADIENTSTSSFESPYNKGGYPPFDPYGQTIGKYTNLDKIHDSTAAPPFSDNPMDPNWGGTEYTKDAVESGKYIENNVYPVNYSMPGGVQFYPGLYKTYPDPPNYTKTVGGAVPPFLQ